MTNNLEKFIDEEVSVYVRYGFKKIQVKHKVTKVFYKVLMNME